MRAIAAALLGSLAIGLGADAPLAAREQLWIERPEAVPWLPALQAASDRTGLPVAVLAELIGVESGFRNIHNLSGSTAAGLGQQIAGNSVMLRYHLHPMRPTESIMGAAIELRERQDRTGSLAAALVGYGTTKAMPPAKRRQTEARFAAAAAWAPPPLAVASWRRVRTAS